MKTKVTITVVLILHSVLSFAQKEFETYHGRGTMYINEDYANRSFSKLLVITGSHDKDINDRIIKEFTKNGIKAVNSLDIISPVKEYTDLELKSIYTKNNIDGIVKAEIKDKDTGGSGIPNISTTVFQIEISLFDLQNDLKAVTFIGRAQSTGGGADKAVQKFFRAIMEELKPVVNL